MKISTEFKISEKLLLFLVFPFLSLIISAFIIYTHFWNLYPIETDGARLLALLITAFVFSGLSIIAFLTSFYLSLHNYVLKKNLILWMTSLVCTMILDLIWRGLFIRLEFGFYLTFTLFQLPFFVIPQTLLGITVGLLVKTFKIGYFHRLSLKSIILFIILTLEIGLFLTLSTGVFFHYQGVDNYSNGYHYYLNRGAPFLFSGTSARETPVPTGIIKVPTLLFEMVKSVRVIDLPTFFKSLLLYSLFFLMTSWLMVINFKISHIIKILVIGIILVVYAYYFWGQIV